MKLRIREIAQKKGFTQKMLAEKMGVSINTIKWYYKSESISTCTVEKIAEVLECHPWQLITTEYEVLTQSDGEVITPTGQRVPLKKLQYCFDYKG